MNENKKLSTKWQDNTALQRFQIIAPLLNDTLDSAALLRMRKQIAFDSGLSEKRSRDIMTHISKMALRG